MLGPAAAVKSPQAKSTILAPPPGEHLTMDGKSSIVALSTSYLDNAQSSQGRQRPRHIGDKAVTLPYSIQRDKC